MQLMVFVKGEVYPEMKLCELLVLVHCIHLPLILFAEKITFHHKASSDLMRGQSE